jgi:hypothetical protein
VDSVLEPLLHRRIWQRRELNPGPLCTDTLTTRPQRRPYSKYVLHIKPSRSLTLAPNSLLHFTALSPLSHGGYVSFTHSFSVETTRKRPLLSPINLRHGPHIENIFHYCKRVYSSVASHWVWSGLH